MKKLTKLGVLFFVMLFIAVSGYKSWNYQNVIEKADISYTQSLTDFINNWYNNTEQDLSVIEKNKTQNEQGMISNVGNGSKGNENSNELDNLVVPTFTSGLEAFIFAEKFLSLANGLHVEVRGTAEAMDFVQNIINIRKEDNEGNLYSYSGTYGTMKKVGIEAYYNKRQLKVRKAESVNSDLTANFKNNWQFSSPSTYLATYGSMPNQLNYIVNQGTVLEENNFKFENGLYTFQLKLDTKLSTERYKYNIKTTAESTGFPTFKNILLTVTIDEFGRFKSIVYNEEYAITVSGFTATTHTNMTETFLTIHGDVDIPVPSGF